METDISKQKQMERNVEDLYSKYFIGGKRIPKIKNRKRVEKSQGCSKMQYLCTSQIKVIQKEEKVHVMYYKTHYQHKCEIQHLRIGSKERNNIASKLMSGVSVSRYNIFYDNFIR